MSCSILRARVFAELHEPQNAEEPLGGRGLCHPFSSSSLVTLLGTLVSSGYCLTLGFHHTALGLLKPEGGPDFDVTLPAGIFVSRPPFS